MEELRPEDVQWVVSRLPRDIKSLLETHANKLILAGGAIRAVIAGERISDYDIMGPSEGYLEPVANALLVSRGASSRKWKTNNAISILTPSRTPVQFITRWCYTEPEAVVKSFDFTIAQAVVWYGGKAWKSLRSSRFYSDLAAKRLYYTVPARDEDAGGSMMRVRKFLSRGYNIQPYSLAGVMARCFDAVDTDRLPPVPNALAEALTAILREVDPLNVVDGIDMVEEHGETE